MTDESPAVLVLDDEPILRDTIAEFLEQEGFRVTRCATGEEALARAQQTKFAIALCDVNLPGLDGFDVLQRLSASSSETRVILFTAYATVEAAVEAFHQGAHDYLVKPIQLDELLQKIRKLLDHREFFRAKSWLKREVSSKDTLEFVVGSGSAMKRALDLAKRVAPSPSTVLILGESGTGKDLLARAIHRFAQQSRKTTGDYVAVNCAAIPGELLESQLFGHRKGAFTGADRDAPGVFAYVGTGTVFLDEIGELPLQTQAKLLRAIEQKEVFPVGATSPVKVQARILAATNRDLKTEVEAGRFRNDLFFRLNVVSITLPPLRERLDDLPELISFLLPRHAEAIGKPFVGVDFEAMRSLFAHAWPGNIRELDNALQRAVVVGEPPHIRPNDLPPEFQRGTSPEEFDNLDSAYARFERDHLSRILKETPDKRRAAQRLGIGLSSLYRKIDEHKLVLS